MTALTYNADYDRVSKSNLKKALINRQYYTAIEGSIKKSKDGSIIFLEVPSENYLEANITSIKSLLNKKYKGTYISFQRPFKNIRSLFEQNDIDMNDVLIVDAASALCGEMQEDNPRCVSVSINAKIEEIAKATYQSLLKLDCENKFVYVDSLSTLALHEPLSDSLRFPRSLIDTIRQNHVENVVFIFNIAIDISSKRYAENILTYADSHIHLGRCT